MKKRTLALLVCMVLALTVSLGTTLAYLTSEDGDVNVMTLGKVEIKQHEYERVTDENGDPVKGVEGEDFTSDYGINESYKLQEFTSYKPAMPAVYQNGTMDWDDFQQLWNQVGAPGSNDLFDDSMKNVIDKFVFVENTGKSDAYYRTIIAIECPEGLTDGTIHTSMNANNRFDYNSEKDGAQNSADSNKFYTKINGVRYLVYTATYLPILTPGEVSRPSLLQLYLDPAATNEDVALFGDNWEVLTLSQAVQAAGFADAHTALNTSFYDPTTDEGKAKLVADLTKLVTDEYPQPAPENGDDPAKTYEIPADAYVVTNTEELAAALKAGETTIKLMNGEYNWSGTGSKTAKNLSLYGESKDVVLYTTLEGSEGADYDFDGATVTFTGLTIDVSKHAGSFRGWARMNGTYNDCVIVSEYCLYGVSEFNYCTLNTSGDVYNIRTWGATEAKFTNCTFNSDGKAMLLYSSGGTNTKLTLENCLFNDTGVLPDLKAAVEIGADYGNSYELIVNNTTVNGYEINDKGINTNTTLWGNKNSLSTDRLNVVVDGVDVY